MEGHETKFMEEKTPMRKHMHLAILAGLVVGLASLPALAMPGWGTSRLQPALQTTQGSSHAKAKKPPKVNPKEEKAYKGFYDTPTTDPQKVVSVGQKFLKKYPTSRYAAGVYSRMAQAYENLGDTTKMFDAGHKALQLNPDDVDVLSLMAYSIPRRIDPNDIDSGAKLQEASQDATHALELLSKMQKPAKMTAADFTAAVNTEAASCHSGLGLVDYYNHNIPGMISELEQAVKLDPTPDQSNQYLLGIAYMQAHRPADAEAILQKCTAEPGPLAGRCQESLGQAKKMAAQAKQ